jgi:hypothetical protein
MSNFSFKFIFSIIFISSVCLAMEDPTPSASSTGDHLRKIQVDLKQKEEQERKDALEKILAREERKHSDRPYDAGNQRPY